MKTRRSDHLISLLENVLVCSLFALLAAVNSAQAADFLWDGSSGTDWATTGNWTNNAAPNTATANVILYDSGAANLNNYSSGTSGSLPSNGRTIGSLTFNDNADSNVTINVSTTGGAARILHLGSASVSPTITVDSGAAGNFTIQGGSTFGVELVNNLTVTHNGSGILTIGSIINTINNSGALYGITKEGTGTLVLSYNGNTYSGTNTINAGTLLTTQASALSGYNASGKVVVNGGVLGVRVGGTGWSTAEVNTLLANATKTAGALGIDTTNGNRTNWTTFTTSNLGNLGLAKLGSNTLTLTNANTYAGATTISAGTLTLSSSGLIASSSTIDIQSGAFFNVSAIVGGFTLGASQTLKGNGTLIGTITANGTISPGASIGTLTVGNLTLAGTTVMEIDRDGTPKSDLISASSLTFGGTLTVTNIGAGTLQAGDTFNLFDWTTGPGETLFSVLNLPDVSSLGLQWNTANLSSVGEISLLAIPEPSTLVLVGLGLVGALGLRRRPH